MGTGALLATAGTIWLTQLGPNSAYGTFILPAFIVMSLGMGLVFVPLGNVALTGVASHDAGVASALVNSTQQVGGSLGTALLNSIFTTAMAGYLTAHGLASIASATLHGYSVAFTVSAGLIASSAVIVFLLVRAKRMQSTSVPALAD